jgi:hypothetical protein
MVWLVESVLIIHDLTEAKESLRNMLTTKYLRSNIEESLIE